MITDNRIAQLADKYGTPLYIYDKYVMEEKVRQLKTALFSDAHLYYAMKANPLLGICQEFRRLGTCIEVASAGELTVALKAGFEPETIVFTSPGKTTEEISFALESGVGIINIESIREAEIIDRIAASAGKVAGIGIRVNPKVAYSNAKIKMSGVSSQFGIEEEDINPDFYRAINNLTNIRVLGYQVYMGTQMLNAEDLIKNTEYVIQMALRLEQESGWSLKYLNCGGGFGVKYFKNEEPLDLAQLQAGMEELHRTYGEKLKDTRVTFESGRFLMAEAGLMVTRVLYTKHSKGMKYAICDGGSNIHSSAAFLGRFVRNNFPLHTIRNGNGAKANGEYTDTTICGPLCTSLDVIGQKVSVDSGLSEGDLVVIEQSGAYGYTYSPSRFLSHESPLELMIDGDEEYILRERGNREDYLAGQLPIEQ